MVRNVFFCLMSAVFVISLIGCGGGPSSGPAEPTMTEEEFNSDQNPEQNMMKQMQEMSEKGGSAPAPQGK